MLTLFAIGTFWFWALLVVESIVLFVLLDQEKATWGTISFIATLAILYFFGGVDLLRFAKENAGLVAAGAAGYFVAGTAWSVGKWWSFVRNARDRYDEIKADFLRGHRVEGTAIPDDLKKGWLESFARADYQRHYRTDNGSAVPKARKHKGRILTWMTYWPWSLIWTLINDPIRKLFKAIYLRIQVLFESIAASAFRGTEDDLTPAAPTTGKARERAITERDE